MKNIKRLVIVMGFGLGLCALAIAQIHRAGAMDSEVPPYHGDAASISKHFAEFFPQIAAFDANKDGKLDEAEKEALGRAIAEGVLQLPAHTPPHGVKPTPEMMLNHIAEMYARVASYDANHDGQLDENEQAAIQGAIEKGEFIPHGQHLHESDSHH